MRTTTEPARPDTKPAVYTWAKAVTSDDTGTARILLLHDREDAGELVVPRADLEVLVRMLLRALESGDTPLVPYAVRVAADA